MKVIPVIDILNNTVVHALKGNRKEYQPLKSNLTSSNNPLDVACFFKLQGFSELYIADLDAILANQPHFELYRNLAQLGFDFMVDAGIANLETAKKLKNCDVPKIILGTETLPSMDLVKEIVKHIGADSVIISLDIKDGQVLTPNGFDGSTDVFELLRVFRLFGVSKFILLDLTRVGSSTGVNLALLKQALEVLNGDGVYVGGGVQNVDDLLRLKELGVLGVLVATALHSGKIGVKDLERACLF